MQLQFSIRIMLFGSDVDPLQVSRMVQRKAVCVHIPGCALPFVSDPCGPGGLVKTPSSNVHYKWRDPSESRQKNDTLGLDLVMGVHSPVHGETFKVQLCPARKSI